MPTNIFYAEEGSITVGGTDLTAQIKEVSVTGAERDVEVVRAFGNNQYPDEKPAGALEISATVVPRDSRWFTLVQGGLLPASNTVGSAIGDLTPRTRRDIVLNFYDLTVANGAQLRIDAFSAYGVTHEFTLNATDHAEMTIGFKCLPKDFVVKSTSYRTGSPIS